MLHCANHNPRPHILVSCPRSNHFVQPVPQPPQHCPPSRHLITKICTQNRDHCFFTDPILIPFHPSPSLAGSTLNAIRLSPLTVYLPDFPDLGLAIHFVLVNRLLLSWLYDIAFVGVVVMSRLRLRLVSSLNVVTVATHLFSALRSCVWLSVMASL